VILTVVPFIVPDPSHKGRDFLTANLMKKGEIT